MERHFILSVCVNILFICVCRGQNDYYPLVGNSEPDIVQVEQSPGNDFELFPDKYSIWFYYDGEPLYFDLSRDDVMTDALSPSLCRLSKYMPDDLINEDNEKDFAFYHNNQDVGSDTRAHFVVHRPDPAAPANIYGQINHEGYQYTLQASGKRNRHRLRRELSLAEHRAKRALPTAGTDYIIELVVWTAPDLFKYHKSRLGLNNANTAVWLEIYRESLIRDVDLTFKLISGMEIRAYYMGGGDTTSVKESWYKDNFVDPYLLIDGVLANVTTFLQAQIGNGVPDYDHAIVLTRDDLARLSDGTGSQRDAAATGTICESASGGSVSIAEVSGPFYRKLVTQAIGLGFGLNYNFGSDIYTVMARDSPSFPISSGNRVDIWSFRSVSVVALKAIIDGYTSNCLTSQDAGTDFENFIKTAQTYGELYDQDSQCAILYGSGSTACSGNTDPSTTCFEDAKCEVSSVCDQNIIFGDKTLCDTSNGAQLGCRYSTCQYNLASTTTSTTTTSTTTATTSTTTSTTTSSTTSSTTSTTSSTTSTTNPTTSTTNPSTTSTDEELSSSPTMIPSSTPEPDCCCERRPLGQVKIDIEYIPCPDGNPNNRYIP